MLLSFIRYLQAIFFYIVILFEVIHLPLITAINSFEFVLHKILLIQEVRNKYKSKEILTVQMKNTNFTNGDNIGKYILVILFVISDLIWVTVIWIELFNSKNFGLRLKLNKKIWSYESIKGTKHEFLMKFAYKSFY